jgi:hypothetical protein
LANASDWQMEGIGDDGMLRHFVPTPMAMRVFLVACGLFVLIVSTLELGRAVWPLTLGGLFFLVILLGAYSVGGPMVLAGLLAPTSRWTVSPQRIEIALDNPFRLWRVSVGPGSVAGFELRESDNDGGPSSWYVVMRTIAGKRFESRPFGSKEAADRLRRDIEAIFYGRSV